ncbi:MAG TPA: hypothetical protein VM901_00975 [Bdellovibrionota bacterium]|jgi:hypothetical protein|nr:hypothetical protein [Bdellovibrionota bacterium]
MKKSFWRPHPDRIAELRKLQRAFEHLALRVAMGSTFEAALRSPRESPRVGRQLSRQWVWLREAITRGQIPPRAGIEAFGRLIEMQIYSLSQMRRHGLGAKIQSRVLGLVSVAAILALSFVMDAPLASPTNLIALALAGLGFLILSRIRRHIESHLWRLEWLLLWFYVGTLIEWGMTPAQALAQSQLWCELSSAVPRALRERVDIVARALRTAESAPEPLSKDFARFDPMDHEILTHFAQAAAEGLPTSLLLKNYGEIYRRWMQKVLEECAEKSAYWNLVPLYFCFAPALFVVLLGQILMSLTQAS